MLSLVLLFGIYAAIICFWYYKRSSKDVVAKTEIMSNDGSIVIFTFICFIAGNQLLAVIAGLLMGLRWLDLLIGPASDYMIKYPVLTYVPFVRGSKFVKVSDMVGRFINYLLIKAIELYKKVKEVIATNIQALKDNEDSWNEDEDEDEDEDEEIWLDENDLQE